MEAKKLFSRKNLLNSLAFSGVLFVNTLNPQGISAESQKSIDIPKVVSTFAQAIRDKDRLACKWAPRKCAVIRDELKMTNKEYRKWL